MVECNIELERRFDVWIFIFLFIFIGLVFRLKEKIRAIMWNINKKKRGEGGEN